MKTRISALFIFLSFSLLANGQDFPYGAVSLNDLNMTTYDRDTSAGAVVLKEFGESMISNEDYQLIFKHHVRIKILDKSGLDQANFEIPLYKQSSSRQERIVSVKASSFNLVNNQIQEELLAPKNIYEEDSKYWISKKFAIPNVRVGSVIEVAYVIQSPFIFNFRSWEFQSEIPKVESEYVASIPGVYRYNITLRGFQKLTKNESKVVRNCLGSSTGGVEGGFSADCSVMHLGMKNIPAFIEEDYMTAKKNFLSAIHFELSEVRHPDGRIDKVTKEWRDAEQELRTENRFGVQLRRGKDIGEEVRKLVATEADEFVKAKKVYDFIKEWFLWNESYGKYSESGIKKAFDDRKGNVGDINLSLIAALRYAGLDVEPVILSTRANGAVVELHPVLSEFNYVIAKVNIGDKTYLADATEKFYPFGLLPERCLNGKGRVMADKDSYWIDLKPTDVRRTLSQLNLALGADGVMRGTLETTYAGYDAVAIRETLAGYQSMDDYINDLRKSLNQGDITGYEIRNVEDYEKSVVRKLDIAITAFDANASNVLFNPFILEKLSKNPFKSNERLYPVDFGAPLERTTILNLEYPEAFAVENVPDRVGLSLPNGGGHFIFESQNTGNKLSLSNSLAIKKTVFSSGEYHYLKELFNRIIQVQNGELIFKKKT